MKSLLTVLLAVCSSLASAALDDPAKYSREFRQLIPKCNDVARSWIRMAFHDAGTFQRGQYGADGSLQFELDRKENADFKESIEFYSSFGSRGISMADAIMYGAKLAVEVCGGPRIAWHYGRLDAKEANPPNLLPDPHVSSGAVFQNFVENMGFTLRETVALIGGAHSVAKVNDQFDEKRTNPTGPTDLTPDRLDNEWFRELLGSPEDGVRGTVRIPADSNMMRDPRMVKEIRLFASNVRAFRIEFKRAFEKLMDLGARFEKSDYATKDHYYSIQNKHEQEETVTAEAPQDPIQENPETSGNSTTTTESELSSDKFSLLQNSATNSQGSHILSLVGSAFLMLL